MESSLIIAEKPNVNAGFDCAVCIAFKMTATRLDKSLNVGFN
jgi:hypothetical protein